MKILQLIQKPQLRGAEIFASQLSNQLLKAGHEVIIASLIPGRSVLPFKGEVIHLNRSLEKRFWDWRGWRELSNIIAEFNPDIIQSNAGDTLKFAVFSKLIFRWKVPLIFRNANKVSDFIDSYAKLLFNRFLMKQVNHVISVSEMCRRDFIKTYSFELSKITTVPIGIETEINNTSSNEVLSIFKGEKVMVHTGAFVPEKNHEVLVRIVEKVFQVHDDLKLVLVGDGKLRQSIEKMIQEKNLQSKILLVGYQRDVLSIIQQGSVLLLPSKIEGMPAVILEAMYCKTPVVAYDVGGISEVVKNKETGWLVKAGDEEGFVKAINDVLAGGHGQVIDIAYNMVIRDFDNREIARRFLKVYEKVISDF